MLRLNLITTISLVLLIVGALNWGFVGIFDFDLVSAIFGRMSFITRLIYSLVGIAAVTMLFEIGIMLEHYRNETHDHKPAHPV